MSIGTLEVIPIDTSDDESMVVDTIDDTTTQEDMTQDVHQTTQAASLEHRLQKLKKRHLKLKLPPITTHVTQQDTNHSKKRLGTNNLMYRDANKDNTNKEASGKIKACHGSIQVQHGIIGIDKDSM